MHDLDRNENRKRGTYEFPFEFHHIDSTHPRYVMSYHWHVEYELMRILKGTLTVTLDEKVSQPQPEISFLYTAESFTAECLMIVSISVLFLTETHF